MVKRLEECAGNGRKLGHLRLGNRTRVSRNGLALVRVLVRRPLCGQIGGVVLTKRRELARLDDSVNSRLVGRSALNLRGVEVASGGGQLLRRSRLQRRVISGVKSNTNIGSLRAGEVADGGDERLRPQLLGLGRVVLDLPGAISSREVNRIASRTTPANAEGGDQAVRVALAAEDAAIAVNIAVLHQTSKVAAHGLNHRRAVIVRHERAAAEASANDIERLVFSGIANNPRSLDILHLADAIEDSPVEGRVRNLEHPVRRGGLIPKRIAANTLGVAADALNAPTGARNRVAIATPDHASDFPRGGTTERNCVTLLETTKPTEVGNRLRELSALALRCLNFELDIIDLRVCESNASHGCQGSNNHELLHCFFFFLWLVPSGSQIFRSPSDRSYPADPFIPAVSCRFTLLYPREHGRHTSHAIQHISMV